MLRKTKIVLLIGSVLLVITIIVTLLARSLKTSSPTTTTPLTPESASPTISLLMRSSSNVAQKTKAVLLPKLPIEIKNFDTSVGLKTNISISSFANDNPEVVRIEITGIDYQYNQNDPATNPNMVAFKESFEKAKAILSENQIDIRNLHISLSNRLYIREIAEVWIKTLNLLP